MTSKLPYLPFYVNDFLADTQHLSTEQKGIYVLLLCAMWHSNDATIPNNDKNLASITGLTRQKWKIEKAMIMPFLTPVRDGEGLTQKRLRSEQIKAGVLSGTRSRSAKHRWGLRKNKINGMSNAKAYANADAPVMQEHMLEHSHARVQSSDNNKSSFSSTFENDVPHADALGASPTGPPSLPISDKLLNTKIVKKGN